MEAYDGDERCGCFGVGHLSLSSAAAVSRPRLSGLLLLLLLSWSAWPWSRSWSSPLSNAHDQAQSRSKRTVQTTGTSSRKNEAMSDARAHCWLVRAGGAGSALERLEPNISTTPPQQRITREYVRIVNVCTYLSDARGGPFEYDDLATATYVAVLAS